MDSVVLIPSIVLGSLGIGIYLVGCLRRKIRAEVGIMISTLLQASGVVCGLVLMAGSVYAPAKDLLKGIDIYIFIGGLAVMTVSIQAIVKDIWSR